jgi:NO-binding membrane sensor protein with MHYT domain
MVAVTSTNLAVAASAIVAVLASVLAYLGFRSFHKTRNPRLVFVAVAFLVFAIKSVFVGANVQTHLVPHDAIEFVSALFDLVIVVLLFLPFAMNRRG